MKSKLKILLFFFICYLYLSCSTTKQKSSVATKITYKETKTAIVKENLTVKTKQFGDTLKGSMPLPKLADKPVILRVESSGISLDLALTKTTVAYKIIPKITSTTTINSVKETDTKAVADVVRVKKEKATQIQQPWRPPWWSYLLIVAILIGIVTYFSKPIKSFLLPILKLFK